MYIVISFTGLLALQVLNLASNGITTPPWQALNTMSSLQYLYLQVNIISFFLNQWTEELEQIKFFLYVRLANLEARFHTYIYTFIFIF